MDDTELWNTDILKVKDFTVLDNGEERTMVFNKADATDTTRL
jgi:hypothetical protein